jgi:recombination protein RecA
MIEIDVDSVEEPENEKVEEAAEEKPKKAAKKTATKEKTAKKKEDPLDKKKGAANAMKSLQKSLGDRASFKPTAEYDAIPTGVLILDDRTGVGGWPRGRVCDIFGWEATGKTTLMTQAMVEAQRLGYTPAFVDFEHAYDEKYAHIQGLDTSEDKFLYVRPTMMEDCDPILTTLITEAKSEFIVVDSVPSMITDKSMRGDKETLAELARYMSQHVKKWAALADENDCCLVFINQMRSNIGHMGADSKATGGRALPFYASLRIELVNLGKESRMVEDRLSGEKEKTKTANKVKAVIKKNKMAPTEGQEGRFRIVIGEGVDNMHTLREYGEKRGFIKKAGAYLTYTSPNNPDIVVKGLGAHNFDQHFLESPVLFQDLRDAIGL